MKRRKAVVADAMDVGSQWVVTFYIGNAALIAYPYPFPGFTTTPLPPNRAYNGEFLHLSTQAGRGMACYFVVLTPL